MPSSHILCIVHSRRKILVPKTTDLKYLRETTRLKSPIEYEAAGYNRPRETKERNMLVETYRKTDLISVNVNEMDELIVDWKLFNQCHFILLFIRIYKLWLFDLIFSIIIKIITLDYYPFLFLTFSNLFQNIAYLLSSHVFMTRECSYRVIIDQEIFNTVCIYILHPLAKIVYDSNPDTIKLLFDSIKTSREYD